MKRRVTFVLPSLHGGGAERAAVILLNGLAARGDETTLFVFAKEGAYFDQLSDRVQIVVGRAGRRDRIASLRRFLCDAPQSVVVSFLIHFTTFAAVRSARSDAKYAISQQTPLSAFLDDHDYAWRRPLRRRLFTVVTRSVYPRVDGIAATSRGVADDLIANFNVRPARVSIVPNPVDIDAVRIAAQEPIDPALERHDVPTIVTAGRLAHAKNLPLLVESLQRLAQRVRFRAWVLGAGELEAELRQLLDRALLGQDVTLLGFQPNPWKFMARADVFVLTSRYEGFGNVLIEAMACGLPTVATASYGTRDIVRPEQTGLLVERHEASAVADAIERVLTDAEVRSRMAAAARTAANDYSVASVVDRFDRFLDALLAQPVAKVPPRAASTQ